MDFTGIDSVLFGADDLKVPRRLFSDWGLRKVRDRRSELAFATRIGSELVVRPASTRGLPPPMEGGSQFREVIFGVASERHLDRLEGELSRDRKVSIDPDGTLHTVDDCGIGIGFRIWRHGNERDEPATDWNGPGHRRRLNRIAPFYRAAQPFKMGHIVFLVPDTKVAETFWRKRVGFWLSDRYVGGAGVFLRWARRAEHHNLFLAKSRTGKVDLHHIAFEVRNVHEVFGGGKAFAEQGWATEVGPGRHPISSAYFWYFKNPLGGAIEYFSDPDHVDEGWTPHNYRVNRFSEWHLADGLGDGRDASALARPSLESARAITRGRPVPVKRGQTV
jgi:catechol 2,3-dioxygenase-like lactoylglutathione lyase family enzyme